MAFGGFGDLFTILGSLGIGEEKIDYEQLNPYTQQTYDQFQNLLGQSDAAYNQYSGQAAGATGQLSGVQNALAALAEQLAATNVPGVEQGYDLYKSREGEIADTAGALAKQFTEPYQETAGSVADRRADQAARDIMAQFGGQGFSGAAQAAAAGAAGDVLSDYETSVANMFGQIGSNFANQMLGQERGLAEAAPQQQFQNIIGNLLNQANLEQARGASLGQQAGLYGNLAGDAGARSRQLLGGLGGLSAPQFAEPMTQNRLGDFGQAVSATEAGMWDRLMDVGDIISSFYGMG